MHEADDTVDRLRRWHAGDAEALHALLDEHLPKLHEFVSRVLDRDFPELRRDQDSLDLVQVAAAKVLGYLPRFLPRDGEQFQGLLRTFVRNDLRNQLRSGHRWARQAANYHDSILDLRPSSVTSELPDRAAEKAEERAWVRLALEFVPEHEDRLLLHMRAVEQASWAEIARELELENEGAARMRYARRVQPRLANILRLLKNGGVEKLLARADTSTA